MPVGTLPLFPGRLARFWVFSSSFLPSSFPRLLPFLVSPSSRSLPGRFSVVLHTPHTPTRSIVIGTAVAGMVFENGVRDRPVGNQLNGAVVIA